MVALGPQREQNAWALRKSLCGKMAMCNRSLGIHVHREINVHPPTQFAVGFVILGDKDILLIHPDNPIGRTTPNKAATGNSCSPQSPTER